MKKFTNFFPAQDKIPKQNRRKSPTFQLFLLMTKMHFMHQTSISPSTLDDSCQTSSFKVHFLESFLNTLERFIASQMWLIKTKNKNKNSALFQQAGNSTQLTQYANRETSDELHSPE